MSEGKWADDADEISLLAIGALMLRQRWRIARWALAGSIIALAIVWTRPALYVASASFIPQGADPARSGLTSLAGQLGVNVPSSGASSLNFTPDFYIRLLTSRELLVKIVRDTVAVPELGGRRIPIEDLLDIGSGSAKVREEAAVSELTRRISATASKSTGLVEYSVATKWPGVSLAITEQLLTGVNDFNERTRREQASAERKFIESQLAVATIALRTSEDRLQQFLQSNHDVNSPSLQFERDRMQRDVTLRQQVFSSLTQSYADVRMREVRDIPVITLVDDPMVPAKPASRGRFIRTLMGLLIGVVIGALVVFIGDLLQRRRASGDPGADEFATTIDEMKGHWTVRLRRLGGRASS